MYCIKLPSLQKRKKESRFLLSTFQSYCEFENYLCIKGRRLTLEESQRLAIISAMATLYDDLIDEENWDKEHYLQILNKTLPIDLQTPKVQLIFALDNELKNYWQPTQLYTDALKLAIEWQVISARQLHTDISLQEVLLISQEKCGNSSLLWASIMDEKWTEQDKQFIYQSGFVGQLVNDLFDAFKDREDGVYTFVQKTKSIAEAKEIFIKECKKLHQNIVSCNVVESKKLRTIRRMACIHAFALVSLEHLQNTENKYGLPMDWNKVSRSELVTDLAFWSNKLKLLKYACSLTELR